MEATPTLVINYYSGFKQNVVPLFQRPYTWSEKQWRTLWDDVMVFYPVDDTNDKATHFMGAVVTMPARSVPVGVSKFLIIDGQQRLEKWLDEFQRDANPESEVVWWERLTRCYLAYTDPKDLSYKQKQAAFKILFTLGMGNDLKGVTAELDSLPSGAREEFLGLTGGAIQ